MLSIEEIKRFYEPKYDGFSQFLFKEYLQYLILKIIFETKYGKKLCFLGGTVLKLAYNNPRFSEDLDFDNFDLKLEEFEKLSKIIKSKLELEGFEVEIKNVYKGAFRCYIRIPKILEKLGFSNLVEEKILIQVDTVPHDFVYNSENKIFNKFGLFFKVKTTPLDILLSQKIWAIFNRKRKKGRDFFDTVFLFSLTSPNTEYLKEKLGISDLKILKKEILNLCDGLDFIELGKDVEVFLINREDVNKVLMFREFIEEVLD